MTIVTVVPLRLVGADPHGDNMAVTVSGKIGGVAPCAFSASSIS